MKVDCGDEKWCLSPSEVPLFGTIIDASELANNVPETLQALYNPRRVRFSLTQGRRIMPKNLRVEELDAIVQAVSCYPKGVGIEQLGKHDGIDFSRRTLQRRRAIYGGVPGRVYGPRIV